MILTPEERERICAQAVAEYPFESCGVILAHDGERRVLPCRNIQNELHAHDPAKHPRDARTGYYIDPADGLRIARLEGEGFALAVIYHSHVDAGAYFSATDRDKALIDLDKTRTTEREPWYPDTTYVVTSVMKGWVAAMAAFRWDAGQRDFLAIEDPSLTGAHDARVRSS